MSSSTAPVRHRGTWPAIPRPDHDLGHCTSPRLRARPARRQHCRRRQVHGQILAMADALTTGIVRLLLKWTTARSRTLAPKRSPCRMHSPLLSSAGSSSPSGPDEDPGSQTRVEPRRHRWTSHLAGHRRRHPSLRARTDPAGALHRRREAAMCKECGCEKTSTPPVPTGR
jgi:hypothetical protein